MLIVLFLEIISLYRIKSPTSHTTTVYGDPPILTSPHPRIDTHSYTAHFPTFFAQSVAHLYCAHLGAVITYVNSEINKDAMLCCF